MANERQSFEGNREQTRAPSKIWRRYARGYGLMQAGFGIGVEVFLLKQIPTEAGISQLSDILGGSMMTFLVVDGAVDAIKGTHRYLELTIWKRLSRNPERKLRLQRDMDWMTGKVNATGQ